MKRQRFARVRSTSLDRREFLVTSILAGAFGTANPADSNADAHHLDANKFNSLAK